MYNVRCKYAKLQTSVPHTKKTAATLHFLHQLTFSPFFFPNSKPISQIQNENPQLNTNIPTNSATKHALTLYM